MGDVVAQAGQEPEREHARAEQQPQVVFQSRVVHDLLDHHRDKLALRG
jgi:hypothetical protein